MTDIQSHLTKIKDALNEAKNHLYTDQDYSRVKELSGEALQSLALVTEYVEKEYERGLEDAAKCCTIGPYFKAPNIGRNLLDAVAKAIRSLKSKGE